MSIARAEAASTQSRTESPWTATQAYGLAVFCLLLGVALGYLFRGSASPAGDLASPTVATSGAKAGMNDATGKPTPEQQKAIVDRAAAPLLEAVNKNPNDFEAVVNLGNTYYDGNQYPDAIKYYQRALEINPNNADVRTDLGTAYWYVGHADRALVEFKKSLKARPNHPGTLFNMGIVEWQGKMNPGNAIAAWQELLKSNPNFPQRQQVEDLIAKAKQHSQG
jgi:cytochrome c-type biogenesis protein CcmH/NrfG